jgi:hypothetical protein
VAAQDLRDLGVGVEGAPFVSVASEAELNFHLRLSLSAPMFSHMLGRAPFPLRVWLIIDAIEKLGSIVRTKPLSEAVIL